MKQLDLSRRSDELLVDEASGVDLVLDTLEQEWVLADLTKLHELVTQTLDTSGFARE